MKAIMNSLNSRITWYKKALDMLCGSIPWENGFSWPQAPGIYCPPPAGMQDMYIMYLTGCIQELGNTIDMLNANGGNKLCTE